MSQSIDTLLNESRSFSPSEDFVARANISNPHIYQQAAADPIAFWESWAKQLHWFKAWDKTLEWELPDAKWFSGGKINACYNCVDRHAEGFRKDKTAIIWEGEPGEVRTISYSELKTEVCKIANALKKMGIQKGDKVCLYMPMVPELAMSMLACARIGAVHSVVFGGFSAESLYDRIIDGDAKLVITADGGWRRGKQLKLKDIVDEALDIARTPVKNVLVLDRLGIDLSESWNSDRDIRWDDIVHGQNEECPCEEMDSEDLLYILYTSGSTGKPKGIMHTTGGYLTGTFATSKWVFDLKEEDIYWCTADCGWVTGHSYVVYGPMSNGATVLMYEGAPDSPDKDRFWKIVEKHKVSILYTAPTAIRAFMKWGNEYPKSCDLSSLRLLGSVGEPINPEAWMWYQKNIGLENCPIVDTWWQTETGQILITPFPGITNTKPGSAMKPFPGIHAAIFDEEGKEIACSQNPPSESKAGYLGIKHPWPGMLRGIYGDRDKFLETYWSKIEGVYFTGDGARIDSEGNFWLLGRVDDVMNVSGHRLSTMEVESALVDHESVAESAVIGIPHEIKGEGVAAFVILKSGIEGSDRLLADLKQHVSKKIGAIARPEKIIFTPELPKTRSGKIMRRLLRDIATGKALGDITTLADSGVMSSLQSSYESEEN